MEPTQNYDTIISAIDLLRIYREVTKNSCVGAQNIKICGDNYFNLHPIRRANSNDKRLNHDIVFKLDSSFFVSDAIPSEASYSRLIPKSTPSDVLEKIQDKVVKQTIEEGFILYDTIAIEATYNPSFIPTQLDLFFSLSPLPQGNKWPSSLKLKLRKRSLQ